MSYDSSHKATLVDWPLERGRKFDSKHFTAEELTEVQQNNSWLRNRDVEDGVYTQFPTHDYSYTYYECLSIEELKRAFLYGNWAIRQGFVYETLAFINQINAGDEWWTVKKFPDGRILHFESITMIRTINHEMKTWIEDFNTSEYEDDEHFRVIRTGVAREHAEELTKLYHEKNPDYANKEARYEVGASVDKQKDVGIYFVEIAEDFFPEYIAQLLKATYDKCRSLDYLDDEFKEKWKELPELRVSDARQLQEGVTK